MGMTEDEAKEFINKLTENIPTWKLVLIDKLTDFKVWFWLKTHKGVDNGNDINNMVAMLEEFDLRLYEQYDDTDLIKVKYVRQAIQEKINELKVREAKSETQN